MGTSCLCSFIRSPMAHRHTRTAHTAPQHTESNARNDFYFNSRSQDDLWCFRGGQTAEGDGMEQQKKEYCTTRHASINIFAQFPNSVHTTKHAKLPESLEWIKDFKLNVFENLININMRAGAVVAGGWPGYNGQRFFATFARNINRCRKWSTIWLPFHSPVVPVIKWDAIVWHAEQQGLLVPAMWHRINAVPRIPTSPQEKEKLFVSCKTGNCELAHRRWPAAIIQTQNGLQPHAWLRNTKTTFLVFSLPVWKLEKTEERSAAERQHPVWQHFDTNLPYAGCPCALRCLVCGLLSALPWNVSIGCFCSVAMNRSFY